MAKISVRPGDGLLVRLPGGRLLPKEGAEVEETALIRKWLRIGDLVQIKPPATTSGKEARK